MNFFPNDDFYILTELTPAEVQQKLEREVAPTVSVKMRFNGTITSTVNPKAYFKGYAFNGIFELEPILNYRNSFNPKIQGGAQPYFNGSRIHVKIVLNEFVLVFMSIWLGFAFLAFISMLITQLINGSFNPTVFVPLGMFIFGYLFSIGCFKMEHKDAKNKLLEIFEGKVEYTQ